MIQQLIQLWLESWRSLVEILLLERGDLLWLPLFPRDARGESVDRLGDCFSHPDADLRSC